MKKTLKNSILGVALSLVVTASLLGGCAQNNTDSATGTDIGSSAGFPVTVTNYDGTELTVSQKPERIASLTLGMDEMLLEMADENRVVGLSGKNADNEAVSNVADKASKFPKIENNIETLLAAKPDLVIGSSWIKDEFLQQLTDNNIPYYGYKTPVTVEEQEQIILDLSKVLGESDKGQAIVDDMNKRMEAVIRKTETSKDKDVKVMAYNMHGSTNANNTIFNDIVQKIGAVNVSAEAGLDGVAKISKEKIIEMNPQVLILMAWEQDDLQEFQAFADSLKTDESLKNVDAIKNDRVYTASNRYMTSVSHHIIEGIEFMGASVYPDVF
ncbi:ABC transporter substrate-binding protein [Eubacterium sp. 1001713B170207_170306_E7]|uniref:ABC transporter substrate-binding protein n=1 Tax=Eubacterium sp. 1001713B170207_170306_E7 TaxID=2787097 RepID=UPI00189AD7E7|nr:ABC transporter substrate-binding protein [Eubacterium sp. 1001713B170207_170306_E7]